jgi:hypothetical protein
VSKEIGVLYCVALKRIVDSGIVETTTGDLYISNSELRIILGTKLRIPYNKQVSFIQELLSLNLIVLTSSPGCITGTNGGQTFYCIKKNVIELID